MINKGTNLQTYSRKLWKTYKYDCRQSLHSSTHTFMIKIRREKFTIVLFWRETRANNKLKYLSIKSTTIYQKKEREQIRDIISRRNFIQSQVYSKEEMNPFFIIS